MNSTVMVLSATLCAALLAGCDRQKEPADKPVAGVPPAMVQPPPQLSSKEAANKSSLPPIQGQADTKEPAQRRDFETSKR